LQVCTDTSYTCRGVETRGVVIISGGVINPVRYRAVRGTKDRRQGREGAGGVNLPDLECLRGEDFGETVQVG